MHGVYGIFRNKLLFENTSLSLTLKINNICHYDNNSYLFYYFNKNHNKYSSN